MLTKKITTLKEVLSPTQRVALYKKTTDLITAEGWYRLAKSNSFASGIGILGVITGWSAAQPHSILLGINISSQTAALSLLSQAFLSSQKAISQIRIYRQSNIWWLDAYFLRDAPSCEMTLSNSIGITLQSLNPADSELPSTAQYVSVISL